MTSLRTPRSPAPGSSSPGSDASRVGAGRSRSGPGIAAARPTPGPSAHRRPAPLALTLVLIVAWGLLAPSPTAIAHDFWIEPEPTCITAGEPLAAHLRVGHGFPGEPVARDDERILRFEALTTDGSHPLGGVDGVDPAGLLPRAPGGAAVLVYEATPASIVLEAEPFEGYLKDEGLDHVLTRRAEAGTSEEPGRELYSRSVKALVAPCGDVPPDPELPLRPTGLPLELVPAAWPPADDGEITVTLLWRGAPLAGARVDVARRGAPTPNGPTQTHGRTDERGRVTLPLDRSGPLDRSSFYIVTSVHMEPTTGAEAESADWRSVWTALTFHHPPVSSRPLR